MNKKRKNIFPAYLKENNKVKQIITYPTNTPAMPKMGGAGNGYAPADYSEGAGMYTLIKS